MKKQDNGMYPQEIKIICRDQSPNNPDIKVSSIGFSSSCYNCACGYEGKYAHNI
jgi:hypothetical protein